MATVLYTLAETIRQIGLYVQPVMPDSAAQILDQLAVSQDARNFTALATMLTPGTALPKPSPVFPRYVENSDDG
jgi:methionyl-tRNA synthetase